MLSAKKMFGVILIDNSERYGAPLIPLLGVPQERMGHRGSRQLRFIVVSYSSAG